MFVVAIVCGGFALYGWSWDAYCGVRWLRRRIRTRRTSGRPAPSHPDSGRPDASGGPGPAGGA